MYSNPSTGFSRGPALPEEFRLLCMLHNIGATTTKGSLTLQQISEWTMMEASNLRSCLKKLAELEYIQIIEVEGANKYQVTLSGIRKVLSIYS